jgi:hypothetical protein
VGGLDNSKILDLLQMVEARLSTCYWRFNGWEKHLRQEKVISRKRGPQREERKSLFRSVSLSSNIKPKKERKSLFVLLEI